MRIPTALFLAFWTTLALLVPSTGWSWCIEDNGVTHLENISIGPDCGNLLPVPDAALSGVNLSDTDWHTLGQHLQSQQHCLDCLDVAAHSQIHKVTVVRGSGLLAPTAMAHLPVVTLDTTMALSETLPHTGIPLSKTLDPALSRTTVLLI